MNKFLMTAMTIMVLSAPVAAQDNIAYKADHTNGTVAFAGKHAGTDFTGQFGEWSVTVNFIPSDITASTIQATFTTATAKTGNAMYDGTLPQGDWFDSKNHAQATFNAETIRVIDAAAGQYATDGELTIKDITKPVSFDFTMTDPNIAPVAVKAEIPLNRLDFAIGAKSDPTAEWVDETITITLDFQAVAAQ